MPALAATIEYTPSTCVIDNVQPIAAEDVAGELDALALDEFRILEMSPVVGWAPYMAVVRAQHVDGAEYNYLVGYRCECGTLAALDDEYCAGCGQPLPIL